MLVEFSVSNFRSIKDEARLSLVARPDKEHEDSIFTVESPTEGARPIRLLRSAAMYGANAAGKTNMVMGLKAMHDIVLRSSGSLDQLPVTPFRFDPACSARPTSLEVVCVAEGVRYQYGFTATADEVIDEWLYAWPSGRPQIWFERNRSGSTESTSWKLGGKLTGDREVWKRATRANDLFLSTAVALNSKQLQPIFDWFRKRLHVVGGGGWDYDFSVHYCEKSKAAVVDFLTAADLAVTDIRIEEKAFSTDMLPKDMPPKLRETIAETLIAREMEDISLQHRPKGGASAELDMDEESHGTQKLFALAGPWLDSLAEGNVIVFDELHDHLHPELVRFLVSRFHDPSANPHGAQLVFTTHDTSILDRDVFRVDQIWFCERNDRLETTVFPLSDFRARKGVENLGRAYLSGRFGALPYIPGSSRQISDSD